MPIDLGGRRDRSRRIERARIILVQREAREHANGSRERHCDHQADKAEQITESKQSKHHPHRVQMHPATDERWRQHIVRERLSHEKDDRHEQDRGPLRPELCYRDTGGNEKTRSAGNLAEFLQNRVVDLADLDRWIFDKLLKRGGVAGGKLAAAPQADLARHALTERSMKVVLDRNREV